MTRTFKPSSNFYLTKLPSDPVKESQGVDTTCETQYMYEGYNDLSTRLAPRDECREVTSF